jgi:hypothetical protein
MIANNKNKNVYSLLKYLVNLNLVFFFIIYFFILNKLNLKKKNNNNIRYGKLQTLKIIN